MPDSEDAAGTVDPVVDSIPEELLILVTDEERRIGARILPALAQRANELAEGRKAKEYAAAYAQLQTEFEAKAKAELDALLKRNTPPTTEDLQALLSQEYLEFTVTLRERGSATERPFVIRELPQAAEARLLRLLQKHIVPQLKQITALEWTTSGKTAEKVQKVIEMLPESADLLAETALICLNPMGEEADVDLEWVKKNLSLVRIWNIIEAQVTAGRFRDFCSAVFRSIPVQTIG